MIFNYIHSNIKEIKSSSYHFKIYLSEINGNYKANEEILCELQDKIYFYKQFSYEKNNNVKELISNIDVSYQTIYNINEKGFTLIYNEVSNKLLKMFDMVGKDNYFNKNYSSLGGENK